MAANVTVAVLIVDDDRDVRDAMADVVQASGRRTFVAADGAEALRMLDQDALPRPLFILLDWVMSPMNGEEFLDRLQLRPDASRLLVIVLTAMDRGVARDLGPTVLGMLRKPFDVEELLATLDRIEDRV
jgi:CheY-like chemotaxis protein